MSYKCEAIVFTGPGTVDFQTFELAPCGPKEVIVRTRYSMVSTGTEIRVFSGYYGAGQNYPLIPGYSVIGEVVETGPEVKHLVPGDMVSCRNPQPVPGIKQQWGAQASMHRCSTDDCNCVLKLPVGIDPFDCLIAEIGAISWRGVKHAGVRAGETALVIGQGLIGTFSAKFLCMQGARTVVADVHTLRLERAPKFGAAAAIDMRDQDAAEKVKQALGNGADVLIEASGQPAAAKQAMSFIRRRDTNGPGEIPRVVFQAGYVEPVEVNLAGFVPTQAVTLLYPADRDNDDRQDVLDLVAAGKISARGFVGAIHPYTSAASVYQALRDAPDANFSAAFSWE